MKAVSLRPLLSVVLALATGGAGCAVGSHAHDARTAGKKDTKALPAKGPDAAPSPEPAGAAAITVSPAAPPPAAEMPVAADAPVASSGEGRASLDGLAGTDGDGEGEADGSRGARPPVARRIMAKAEAPASDMVASRPSASEKKREARRERADDAERGPTTANADPARQRSGLQGGTRDDVAQRQDYLRYLRQMSHLDAHRVDVSQRVVFTVQDDLEQPLPNATVTVRSGKRLVGHLHTFADGRAQFFPRAVGLRAGAVLNVVVEAQGQRRETSVVVAGRDQAAHVVLPVLARRNAPVVDVMFVLDTTGSMGDEIARIQLTLLDVAQRIQRLEPHALVRYGLTEYRDHGDDYVTRVHDFTEDVPAFLTLLERAEAGGGGDTPEALSEGLHAAITGANWTPVAVPNALRLAIVVADAPPHVDDPQGSDYAREMARAAERGIKIFPVAASGLDDQGEYIFRQLAHHTMARFVFITYGGGTSHHVGQFANNNLDDLVVGLVADEMADLMARPRARMRAVAMAH